jgi:hypothetical protein
LTQDDVWQALDAGINYWNWCGTTTAWLQPQESSVLGAATS